MAKYRKRPEPLPDTAAAGQEFLRRTEEPPPPPPAPLWTPELPPRKDGGTLREKQRLRALAIEKAKRQVEALRLYEPLPLMHSFHACEAKIRVIRGSNRSGKT